MSNVQVGPTFPFVVFRQDKGGYPMWGIEGGGFYVYPYQSYDDAYEAAADLKQSGLTAKQAKVLAAEHWRELEEQWAEDARNGL